jgi:hypothetical protein
MDFLLQGSCRARAECLARNSGLLFQVQQLLFKHIVQHGLGREGFHTQCRAVAQ